jgi:hypothetical protein
MSMYLRKHYNIFLTKNPFTNFSKDIIYRLSGRVHIRLQKVCSEKKSKNAG